MYTSRLLHLDEWNYNITQREALAMVYALEKFKHSLLGNPFLFYVDHMALVVATLLWPSVGVKPNTWKK